MQECVFPIMSTDTRGISVYATMPLYSFSQACFISSLRCSAVISFFTFKVISVREPFATGTLIPQPPITSPR